MYSPYMIPSFQIREGLQFGKQHKERTVGILLLSSNSQMLPLRVSQESNKATCDSKVHLYTSPKELSHFESSSRI